MNRRLCQHLSLSTTEAPKCPASWRKGSLEHGLDTNPNRSRFFVSRKPFPKFDGLSDFFDTPTESFRLTLLHCLCCNAFIFLEPWQR
jgi:hypothetical protein